MIIVALMTAPGLELLTHYSIRKSKREREGNVLILNEIFPEQGVWGGWKLKR
jgi:hypothetical protein